MYSNLGRSAARRSAGRHRRALDLKEVNPAVNDKGNCMAGQGMAGTFSLRTQTRGMAVAQAHLSRILGVRRQGSPVEANGAAGFLALAN